MRIERRKGIIIIGAVIVIVVLIALFRNDEPTDELVASGTVEATEARLGFLSAGRISVIEVREGDTVKEGQVIAALDRAETMARLKQANAQVDAAKSLLEELEAGARDEELAQARAAGDAVAQRLEDARRDLERAEKLYDEGAVSEEVLDKARTTFEVATSQYTQAIEKLREIETGPRREKIDAQRAALSQAEANVAAIEAILSNMEITAPFDGVVTVRNREPGEVVSPGAPVVTIQNPEDRWVRIFVPEGRIGAVHLGADAEISTDSFVDRSYPGEVIYIASEAEFTPKTVQTTEERVRLVYAVKVEIEGDDSRDLKPGMPADVRVSMGDK